MDNTGKSETNSQLKEDPHRRGRTGPRKWIFLGLGALGIVIIIGLLVVLPSRFTNLGTASRNTISTTPTDPAPMDAAPSLGPKNAPVTIIEYADFGCPSCWYWYKAGILTELRARYGDQIRFVWRDYPVITLLSPDAAEAGQCANEQGRFWQFHDAVYDHQGNIGPGDLETYAKEIGLNTSQFKECVTSHRYRDRVNAEEREAFTHGYNGAPFFLVNGELVVGPQSHSFFESLIDPILAAKK